MRFTQLLAFSAVIIAGLAMGSDIHLGIKMLSEFISSEMSKLNVILFLCGRKVDGVNLHHVISKTGIRGSFQTEYIPVYNREKPRRNKLFVFDMNCKNSKIFFKADVQAMCRYPSGCLLIFDEDNAKVLRNITALHDSQLYIATRFENTYRIQLMYKLCENWTEFIKDDYANWSEKDGLSIVRKNDNVLTRRFNMMGIHLSVSLVISDNESLNHLWDYRDTHIDGISKLNYILFYHLADFLNASRTFLFPATWGYRDNATKLFSGMVGEVQQGVADIGGSPAFFTEDRIPVVDYLAPTWPTKIKFIFRAPPLSYAKNVFILPFDTSVWIASLLLILLTLLCLYVVVVWEWKDEEFKQTSDLYGNKLRPKLFDAVIMELGAISQQGSEAEPMSVSGRIVSIITFVSLMFLYTAYSAYVVVLLQSTTDSIKALPDLLNTRIKLGVEDLSYARYFFSVATGPVRRAIYEQKVVPKGQPPNFMPIYEGIQRIRDEFFAFHVEQASGYKLIEDTFTEHEKCGLTEMEFWEHVYPWSVIGKNYSRKEIVKIGLRRIAESGVQSREVRRICIKKPLCQAQDTSFVSVGLLECYFPFAIFLGGVFLAGVFFVFEVVYLKLRQARIERH